MYYILQSLRKKNHIFIPTEKEIYLLPLRYHYTKFLVELKYNTQTNTHTHIHTQAKGQICLSECQLKSIF